MGLVRPVPSAPWNVDDEGNNLFQLKRPTRQQGYNGLGFKLPPVALGVIVAALTGVGAVFGTVV